MFTVMAGTTYVAHEIGVVSRRCVIEFGLIGGVMSNRSLSVGEVDGAQSRALMTQAQSTPSPRDTASEEAPGVLPERAPPRGPFPPAAWRRMTRVRAWADAPAPS